MSERESEARSVLHSSAEWSFNGRTWLAAMRTQLTAAGCQWRLNHTVLPLKPGGHISHQAPHQSSPEVDLFDAVVVCSGSEAQNLLPQGTVRVPLLNMDLISMTWPMKEPHLNPNGVVVDLYRRLSLMRNGQRLRATSLQPLWPGQDVKELQKKLVQGMTRLFPDAADLRSSSQNGAQTWRETCAFTPDDWPVVGPTPLNRVWVLTGLGAKGWLLAPQAATLLAEAMTQGQSLEDWPEVFPGRSLG